jgi:ABC-type transporter Mla subunit MlaD
VQLLIISGFALSCFGILLFLWITFGGPTPFKAKPYEIKIPFNEATQLAQQSDVRISGVSIGKVQSIEVAPNGKQALATVDINDKYGPIPLGSRAILRTKTLLGETYVELTPGSRNGPKLEDGSTLPAANVAESVQLDEIFRTFDAPTRAAFQEWMQNAAIAIEGRGQSLSNAFGQVGPTLTELDKLFRVLDMQRLAVKQVLSNGAVTLTALRGREGQLAELIDNSNAVFQTTAARERDIEALFRAFPTFQDESKLTVERLKTFAVNTDPLMRQLVPVAEQLSPTLVALSKLAPQAKGLFEGLEPVIAKAPTGFPALRKFFRDQFPTLLRAVDPFLRNVNPLLVGVGQYKHEVAALAGNIAAATNAVHLGATGKQIHYIRALGPFGPESLATFAKRTSTNRNSAYPQRLAGKELASGLLNFDTRQCSAGIVARLNPASAEDPVFKERVKNEVKVGGDAAKAKEEEEAKAKDFFERLKLYAYGGQESSASIPAPGCNQQGPFTPIYGSGPAASYQQTFEQNK